MCGRATVALLKIHVVDENESNESHLDSLELTLLTSELLSALQPFCCRLRHLQGLGSLFQHL